MSGALESTFFFLDMAIEDGTEAAGNLANIALTFAKNHEDGIVALVLLVATIVTLSGRPLVKPTVFMLGFLPFVCFFASAFWNYFCVPLADGKCPNAAAPLHILAGLLSLLFSVFAGILVLQKLFPLATFLLVSASGVILVLVLHILLQQPKPGPGDIFLYAVCVAAALCMGILSLSYLELMLVVGLAVDFAAIAMYALMFLFRAEPSVMGQVPEVEGSALGTLVYAVGVIALSCYGIFVQLRLARAERQPSSAAAGTESQALREEALIASYGAADNEFSKSALGAGPLLAYDEEVGGQS